MKLLLLLMVALAGAMEVIPRPQMLYSTISPKLRIQGSGFGTKASDVELDFIPSLEEKKGGEKIYSLNVTDTALVLTLKKGKKWPTFEAAGADGSTLILTSLKIKGLSVLGGPVPVAQVLEPPSVVKGEDKLVYMTGTRRFLINGTGFREGIKLTLDPPLIENEQYTLSVKSAKVIQLSLKTGAKWRSEPGPLKLRRIDIGAGSLRIDPKFGGVTIAEVQADLGGHGVSVESTWLEQKIFQTKATLTVKGSGFDHVKSVDEFGPPKLRWGNGLLGRGVNYTTVKFSDTEITLKLQPFSTWRKNGANLPAPLTLLAVDAGSGFVAVGPTEAKKGVRVATIFENVIVTPQPQRSVFRTHTAQIWITGSGFTRPGQLMPGGYTCQGTTFDFDPPLRDGDDILVTIFNRTHALIRLRDTKAWAAQAGLPLKITAVKNGAGKYNPEYSGFPPVVIAHIVQDQDFDEATFGGIVVHRSNHQILYQTPAFGSLTISGSKLSPDTKLFFDPVLTKGLDYEVARADSDQLTLRLIKGRKWRATAGPLILKQVQPSSSKEPVSLAHGTGIVVADIVANPTIYASRMPVTASTTRRINIRGVGFSLDGVEITLEPTWANSYEVEAVYEDEIVLKLKDGSSWLPTGNGVTYRVPAAGVPIMVTKIDTSAGEYVFKDSNGKLAPVQVATVIQEPSTSAEGDSSSPVTSSQLKCEDSCAWSFDGTCDEARPNALGSQSKSKFFDDDDDDDAASGRSSARQFDDDYGGFYGDDYGPQQYSDGKRGGLRGGGDDDDMSGTSYEGGEEEDYGYDYGTYGYDYFYDDAYGYYADDGGPVCAPGTDCTDCGGPAALAERLQEQQTSAGNNEDEFDDAWFDDDTDPVWDDDYDFGDGWSGFADDDKINGKALGIISSVDADKKPHKRHGGLDAYHWFHAKQRKQGKVQDSPTLFERAPAFLMGLLALSALFLAAAKCIAETNKSRKTDESLCHAAVANSCPSAFKEKYESAVGYKPSKD